MGRPKKIVNKIPTEDKLIPSVKTSAITSALPTELEITPENIESIILTCDKVGLTREKCIIAINESLAATKMVVDKYGEEHTEPDHDKRLKGALAGLELRQDFRSKVAGSIDNSKHTHVTYQWLSAPVTMNENLNVQ